MRRAIAPVDARLPFLLRHFFDMKRLPRAFLAERPGQEPAEAVAIQVGHEHAGGRWRFVDAAHHKAEKSPDDERDADP